MKNHNRSRLKLITFFIVLFFALSGVICTCSAEVFIWSQTYGGAADDTAPGETVQTSDGGYAVFGDTKSFGAGGSDFWLIKTDANGTMQWNVTYGGTDNEASGDMCLTSDEGYALLGGTYSFGAGSQDFWLIKTYANGTMQWNMTYGGTGNDYGYHVIQTVDGGYALLGQTNSFGAGGNDFWLVKTDESGNMEWNMTYGGTGSDTGIHVLQTDDEGYALAGHTGSFGAGSNDAWLIKTNATGAMEWNMTYGGTGMEFGQCLEQTSDGGYGLACITNSFGAGGLDFWFVKLDSSGNIQWNMTYGGTGNDGPTHFIQTLDGGYAMCGFTTNSSNQDACLFKMDSAGSLEWNMTYGGEGTEIAYALLQTSEGDYLLTCNTNSYGAGLNDIWLVDIPEGLTLWIILLMSAAAFVVSFRFCRKRLERKHW